MMKTITCIIIVLWTLTARATEPIRYVNAADLTVIGKASPTEQPYNRIDTLRHHMPPEVRFYCYAPTGLAIVFRTDSPFIRARWVTTAKNAGSNMTAIAQKGLDLYIRQGDRWVFAGVGNPTVNGKNDHHESLIVANMESSEKECLLYLPLYDQLRELEIGIAKESRIEAAENPFRHRIVVHGSSITHGSSASRAGMSYASRLERRTGLCCINLGFSGQCKMQPEFAAYLADVDADAFLFDCFSNPDAAMIAERFDAFVDTLRAKHPTTPLIFLQTVIRETATFNHRAAAYETRKRQEAERRLQARMANDPNLYFVDPGNLLGDDHAATVDGIHPTDVGFGRMLDRIQPEIEQILLKYNIR